MKNIVQKKIKKIIIHLISKRMAKNDEEIISYIKRINPDVVSLDIFDTLIEREVSEPDEVFRVLESKYVEEYKCYKKIHDLRIEAEIKARYCSSDEEIELGFIYDVMEEIGNNQKYWLKQKEIEIEKMICYRKQIGWNIYNWCMENNKRIVLTSDMYLPKDTIMEILRKCGYFYYEHLFLSSECKVIKASGHLYNYMLSYCGVKANKVVHIGDALKSDYLAAKRMGIKPLLIKK